MQLVVISFKPCWRDEKGAWISSGGFPRQMSAIASLFQRTILVVAEVKPQPGGIPLPAGAEVRPMRNPNGADLRRKLDVLLRFPYYLSVITRAVLQADVVHTPIPGDLAFLGMLVALLLRKRLIVRYGGSWDPNTQNTRTNSLIRWLMRRFAGGRRVMLATGQGERPPAPRMHWIFSTAVSREEIAAIQPDLQRGLSEPARLAYIGRFSPEKGLPVLLKAVARLQKTNLAVQPQFLLMGDGPEWQRLKHMAAELGLDGAVKFSGQLDRPALSANLERVDVCVQASLTEGFSKAWLDAFAHGIPVIASKVGAAPDVIGRNEERGWLVEPGDDAGLAGQIERILTEPRDWPALRRRCRIYAEELTLEAWAEKIAAICAAQWGFRYSHGKLVL